MESPWYKVSGVQGYQRVWRVQVLIERKTPCNVTLSLATDYNSTYTQTHTWTDADIAALQALGAPESNRVLLELHVANQKCSAIRVKVSDSTPTSGAGVGTGQGISLVSLALIIGAKQGLQKLPAAGRF
jgi:hypothetical protein